VSFPGIFWWLPKVGTSIRFQLSPIDEYLLGFQPQNSPLTPPDLTQTYLLIRASQKSKSPIFAFYNCGIDSGASQAHKHIQFISTRDEEADDDDDDDSRPPVEAYVQRLNIEDDSKQLVFMWYGVS
jgi:hypothetical protein